MKLLFPSNTVVVLFIVEVGALVVDKGNSYVLMNAARVGED